MVSVKNQIPNLCKLYSFYEEIPQDFFDETGVDSCFDHNVCDFSQLRHRIVRVSEGSRKSLSHSSCSNFAI